MPASAAETNASHNTADGIAAILNAAEPGFLKLSPAATHARSVALPTAANHAIASGGGEVTMASTDQSVGATALKVGANALVFLGKASSQVVAQHASGAVGLATILNSGEAKERYEYTFGAAAEVTAELGDSGGILFVSGESLAECLRRGQPMQMERTCQPITRSPTER